MRTARRSAQATRAADAAQREVALALARVRALEHEIEPLLAEWGAETVQQAERLLRGEDDR